MACVVIVAAICEVGCVHRRLTIRSNPPGALVYVDNHEIGRTPVSTYFTYYGTRTIRLELDGYETVKQNQRFRAPWYQVPPLDFFSENLSPYDIRDERAVDFQLLPKTIVSTDRLLQRAQNLRSSSQMGVVAPLPNPPSIATPVPAESGTPPPTVLPPLNRTIGPPPLPLPSRRPPLIPNSFRPRALPAR